MSGQDSLALTYRRQKTDPSDGRYDVTASNTVKPWAGANTVTPFGSPTDRGSCVEVTVRSTQSFAANPLGFLRLAITH